MKLSRMFIVMIFWLAGFYGLSQNGIHEKDSLRIYTDELITKINSDENYSTNAARHFIEDKGIKGLLLKDIDLYVAKLKKEQYKCMLYVALAHNFSNMGSYKEAQTLFFKALEIAEKNKITQYQTYVYNVIGNIFGETSMFDRALQNYYRGLKIAEEVKDSATISAIHLNLGTTYYKFAVSNKVFADSARMHLNITIQLAKKLGLKEDLNKAYQSLGLIETDEENYKEAEIDFRKTIEISKGLNDPTLLYYGQYMLARLFINKGGIAEADSALYFLQLANNLAKAEGDFELVNEILYEKARAYNNKGEYKLSSEYAIRFSEYNDSLLSSENMQTTADLNEKYESVKREAQITELNLLQKEKQSQIDRQMYMIIGSVIVLLFVAVAAFSLYRSNQIRKKANFELSEKNNLIEAQKKEVENKNEQIETKNKEILDSIHYAKRIQDSLLPTEKYLERNLNKLKKPSKKS